MPTRRSVHLSSLLICLTLLAGCNTNTEEELAQQRLNVLKAEVDSLEAMKKDLTTQPGGVNPVLDGPGTVSIFLSKNLINSALKGAAGVTLPVPNVKDATLTIKSVTADLKLGYPLVTVDAEATKKDIGLTVQVVGTALLETSIDPAASLLTVNVRLEELVPRAQWGMLDFKISGFVKDLIKAKASKEINNLATIQIPIATDIPLGLPASQMPVTFPGAKANISTPALNISGHVTVSRILVLPDGLHIYGLVAAKVGP
ncbi:MAG: hypothetical protein WCA27_20125 [Candidatus Sulfotelmatobacter sp.]